MRVRLYPRFILRTPCATQWKLTYPGALTLEKLERIVIDSSHIDLKKRGILDMKETQQPLMNFLNRFELKGRYGAASEGIDLLFY